MITHSFTQLSIFSTFGPVRSVAVMPYHLPLSPVDRAIQPPVYYLQVQDSLILSVSIFWTIAYVLYVRQGYRDKSYGMPLFALYVV